MGSRGSEGGDVPREPAMLVRGLENGAAPVARWFENGLEVGWWGARALCKPCMNCVIPGGGGWAEEERGREGGGGGGRG